MKWFLQGKAGFQSPELVREKRKAIVIFILFYFGFQYVAKKIGGWLEICPSSRVYSQIWLNILR